MAAWAGAFRAVHIDFGTGDGAFARWIAAKNPDTGVIGVDASADGLRAASRRALAKPARGGLPNLLLGRLALAAAPGELGGLADALTVLLPWGSLLAAVARPDAAGLAALRGLCKPGAAVRIVFGYGAGAEAAAIRDLGLPPIDGAAGPRLEEAYRQAGLSVGARFPSLEEVRALPTTWAKKLAFSGRERRFVEIKGRSGP